MAATPGPMSLTAAYSGIATVVAATGTTSDTASPSEGSPEDMFGISIGSEISYKNCVLDAAYQLRWGSGVGSGNLITTSEADTLRHSFLVSMIYHF